MIVTLALAAAVLLVLAGSTGAAAEPGTTFLVSSFALPSYDTQLAIFGSSGRLLRVVASSATKPSEAEWSPDGTMIAWVEQGGLVVERADGSQRRLLVPDTFACNTSCLAFAFTWSPDGKQLLVSGTGPQNEGLSVVSVATGAAHQIVKLRRWTNYRAVAWSQAADEIAFIRVSGNPGTASCCTAKLIVARSDGSQQRTLFSARDALKDVPAAAWSPNGKWIAFVTQHFDLRDPACAVINLATGATTVLPVSWPTDAAPVWAPDSSRFAVPHVGTPIDLFTPGGEKIGSFGPKLAVLQEWTSAGLYLYRLRPPNDTARQLLLSPDAREAPHVVFSLPPRRAISFVEPRPR